MKGCGQMSTLLEALSNGSYDLQNRKDMSTTFSIDLPRYRDEIVSKYLNDENIDINKEILNLAKAKSLNDDQIKRVIESVNNQIYLICYNRMTNKPERNVSFNLADFNKIKEESENKDDAKKTEDKKASEEESTLEKSASYQEYDDTFGFFLRDRIGGPLGESAAPDRNADFYKHAAERILSDYEKLSSKEEKYASYIFDDARTIGEAFVEYMKKKANVQEIFDEMTKKAGMNKKYQDFLIASCNSVVDDYKKEHRLPKQASIKLASDNNKDIEKFTLGKYSLSKVASFVECPNVYVNGRNVSNIGSLIKIATDIVDNYNILSETKKQKKALMSKISKENLDIDGIKKMAECGRAWVNNILDNKNSK